MISKPNSGPVSDLVNIDSIGLATNRKGHIISNEFEETNIAGVYALGDVNGKVELTPVALAAGRQLADRLFGGKADAKLDYANIPTVVFSHPTIGTCGLSEQQAVDAFGADNVTYYQSRFTNMYFAMTERKQKTCFKIVCTGPEEKVGGVSTKMNQLLTQYVTLDASSMLSDRWSAFISSVSPRMKCCKALVWR
jgi:glutathione reductase (NADPH)